MSGSYTRQTKRRVLFHVSRIRNKALPPAFISSSSLSQKGSTTSLSSWEGIPFSIRSSKSIITDKCQLNIFLGSKSFKAEFNTATQGSPSAFHSSTPYSSSGRTTLTSFSFSSSFFPNSFFSTRLSLKHNDYTKPRLIESAFENKMRSIPKRANGKASGAHSAHTSVSCYKSLPLPTEIFTKFILCRNYVITVSIKIQRGFVVII